MKKKNSQLIKKLAKEIGFSSCGISKARFLKEEEKNFEIIPNKKCLQQSLKHFYVSLRLKC